MAVCMIFKYTKRFHFAPSFNNSQYTSTYLSWESFHAYIANVHKFIHHNMTKNNQVINNYIITD